MIGIEESRIEEFRPALARQEFENVPGGFPRSGPGNWRKSIQLLNPSIICE